jgi:UDP-N-acetylglucosamine acyltransferase
MIHPSAIIESTLPIAGDVEVGPHAVIRGAIQISPGCRIAARAQLIHQVVLGENCHIGAGSVLGSDPELPGVVPGKGGGIQLGRDNSIRELVTINRSAQDGERTILGNGNYLMAGAHIGHDARMGDSNVIANNCYLGGFVCMGNHIFLGGGCFIRPRVRIGNHVMMRGHNPMSKDVPPFLMAYGPDRILGINSVGLKRAATPPAARMELKRAFKLVFLQGMNLSEALIQSGSLDWQYEQSHDFWDFLLAPSITGVCSQLTDRRSQ